MLTVRRGDGWRGETVGPRGGGTRGVRSGGMIRSANSHPGGPRKQPKVERNTSGAVISRPSTMVPMMGEIAAQP